jgi:tetratricopeptide (TPR) repeat protein
MGRLREAVKSREDYLAFLRSNGNNEEATSEARNLSFAYLALGELKQAFSFAQLGVKLSAQNDRQLGWSLAALGAVMHHKGNVDQAGVQFRLAERSRAKSQSDKPFLYGLAAFQYCDLLLDRGSQRDVRQRANRALEVATKIGLVRDIAMHNVSLGRSYLLGGGTNLDLKLAKEHLELAVDEFRRAGQLVDLPIGLIARAEPPWLLRCTPQSETLVATLQSPSFTSLEAD